MALKYIICFVLLLAGTSAFAGNPASVIREERKVTIDGVEELWRLEWLSTPSPACSPDQPEWMTCPCNGFAFGERGNLVLVRNRPGYEEERLALTRLFDGDFDLPGKAGEAFLRRWDVDAKDVDENDAGALASRVRARPFATVMRFGDYNHDGRPTEFLLQVGTLPCGKIMSVAVGVSRGKDRLHVFGSVENPEKPLVLQASHWEALLKARGPIKVVDWVCGDHGSETETELELSAQAEGIRATRIEYRCKEDGSRGDLVAKEAF
ncbi:MAG: hypothetical protein HY913_21030 [Desulfomonile tiedjei]|nr:hypothetical protein [Desulfomonile tiedjei]